MTNEKKAEMLINWLEKLADEKISIAAKAAELNARLVVLQADELLLKEMLEETQNLTAS